MGPLEERSPRPEFNLKLAAEEGVEVFAPMARLVTGVPCPYTLQRLRANVRPRKAPRAKQRVVAPMAR